MLPLPLKWCMIAGIVSAACHLIVISIVKFQRTNSVSKFMKPNDKLVDIIKGLLCGSKRQLLLVCVNDFLLIE